MVAFCLRIVIAGVGPLLGMIQSDYNLTAGRAGIITTLPLLAFAAFSAIVGKLGQKLGEGKILSLSLLVIAAGTVLRSVGGLWGLYLGTAVLGAGVAVGNVLLPAVVKSEFPEHVGIMTGITTVAMSLAAALSLGVSVPMAQTFSFGWRGTLGIWALVVVITWVFWHRMRPLRLEQQDDRGKKSLLRSPITWYVTLYFAANSMLFYVMIGWLPTILQSGGIGGTEAGYITSLFQLVGIPTSLLAPIWAGRCRDQRLVIAISSTISIFGVLMLMFSGSKAMMIAAALLLGLSNGANFSIGLALFGFRCANASDAARLSGIAQAIGYVIAATGPSVIGALYDLVPRWSICLIYLLVFMLLSLIVGVKAGEDRTI